MSQTIELSKGKTALIDDADFELVSQFKWSFTPSRTGKEYAKRKDQNRKTVSLHRFLLGLTGPSLVVDHINGDGLDNRRSNLRVCTQADNNKNMKFYSSNTSGYRGVHFNKRDQKFQANIRVDKKLRFLGYFNSAIEAAKAYNDAATMYFGEFANLNSLEKN